MNFEKLKPSRGDLDPAAIAFEAGRRSVKRWPWQAASGMLAVALVAVLSLQAVPSTVSPTFVQAPSVEPLPPSSLLALRRNVAEPVGSLSAEVRPERPLRVGDRSF
ncbi:MAG: hypothetical protein AAF743_14750 [Planctomycetota bacterium]